MEQSSHQPNARNIKLFPFAVAAVFVAVCLWGWWVSYNTPNVMPRPHTLVYDAIRYAHETQAGRTPATLPEDGALTLWMQAKGIALFGETFKALIGYQLIFLALLILSVGAIGWKIGGRFAGVVACWVTLFAPTTIGLSVQPDDLLAMQACCCTALALLVWADIGKRQVLAAFVWLPILIGYRCSFYNSTSYLFLIEFCIAAGAFLLWRWYGFKTERNPAPWTQTAGVIVAGLVGLWASMPIPMQALLTDAYHPMFNEMGVASNPYALLAFPWLYWKVFAGPYLAILSAISVFLVFKQKKFRHAFFLLSWLLLPMILLTIINKRHDYYALFALPAAFVLVAYAISLAPKKYKIAGAIAVIVFMGNGWTKLVGQDGSIRDSRFSVFESTIVPYLHSPTYKEPGGFFELGQKIAGHCIDHDNPVLFLNSPGITGWEAFYVWVQNPNIPIIDMTKPPNPNKQYCLAAEVFNQSQTSEEIIKLALEKLSTEPDVTELMKSNMQDWIEFLSENANKWVVAEIAGLWAVLTPATD